MVKAQMLIRWVLKHKLWRPEFHAALCELIQMAGEHDPAALEVRELLPRYKSLPPGERLRFWEQAARHVRRDN